VLNNSFVFVTLVVLLSEVLLLCVVVVAGAAVVGVVIVTVVVIVSNFNRGRWCFPIDLVAVIKVGSRKRYCCHQWSFKKNPVRHKT
jgi:hypothetical protein